MQQGSICFFNTNMAWGGGEKWHLATALEFKRRGYDSFIVANRGSDLAQRAATANIEVVEVWSSRLSYLDVTFFWKIWRLFKRRKVSAVIMNLPTDIKTAGPAALFAGVKHILYRRGMPRPVRNNLLNRFIFRFVLTRVIANSQAIKEVITDETDVVPPEKVTVLYNYLDPTEYENEDQTPLFDRPSDGTVVLGNIGRLVEQKGQSDLIEVARRLKTAGKRFLLLIAGAGPLETELAQKISELELSEYVRLVGFVTDMARFFASIDIFVFPSRFEGSANSLLEAMFFERPIVCYDVSSMPELIDDEASGKLVEYGSIDGFTEAVSTLIDQPELRKRYGAEGRRVVSQRFSKERAIDTLQGFLGSHSPSDEVTP